MYRLSSLEATPSTKTDSRKVGSDKRVQREDRKWTKNDRNRTQKLSLPKKLTLDDSDILGKIGKYSLGKWLI